MKVGILGVGELTEKIAHGLYRADTAAEVILSPRNSLRAENLRNAYDCSVAGSNQSVIDKADVLVIGVRPDALLQLASDIKLRPEQTVVSLVAGVSILQMKTLFGHDHIVRMMLTYAAEINLSTVVLSTCEDKLRHYFSLLGETIMLESESDFELATVSMCMNGWFYYLAEGLQKWLTEKGMKQNDARALILGAMRDSADYARHHNQQPLRKMLNDIATEGTFTAQGLHILEQQQALQPWLDAASKVSGLLAGSGKPSEG